MTLSEVSAMKKLFKSLFSISILAVGVTILSSCHGEDVSGRILGEWSAEWDDTLDGDLDDISVKENICFYSDKSAGDEGTFGQLFEGTVKFDDWENESEVEYSVLVGGTWHIENSDEVVLKYDLDDMEILIGKSNIEEDYTDAAVSFLNGDWSGLMASAVEAGKVKKINQEIEAKVEKGITTYFRNMFRSINKDKEAMTRVEIVDDVMTCSFNQGSFGSDRSYDRVSSAGKSSGSTDKSREKTSGKSSKSYASGVDDEDSSDVTSLTGTVAGKEVVMNLQFLDGTVTGRYRYMNIKPVAWMTLEGSYDGQNLEMVEYNPEGTRCGSFDLNVNHNARPVTAKGSMVNYKGKTYSVDLKFVE